MAGAIDLDRQELRAIAARESLPELSGVWVQEQMLGRTPMLGPLEMLAVAASCTTRLRLGVAVLLVPHYSPVHLAKSLATLDVLSEGRLEVGVASGGPRRQHGMHGRTRDHLIGKLNEAMDLIKLCWTKDRIDFQGRFYQLEQGAMEPKPVQQPHPPIWYGGTARPAVERAAARGDGFIGAGSTTTAKFRECVKILRDQERKVRIAKRVYVHVGPDARQTVQTALHELYSMFELPNLVDVAVCGPPEQVAEGLAEVAQAGAELILLNPLVNEAEQIERLAAEVIPRLSRRTPPRQ